MGLNRLLGAIGGMELIQGGVVMRVLTVLLVQFLDLGGVLAAEDNVVVDLI